MGWFTLVVKFGKYLDDCRNMAAFSQLATSLRAKANASHPLDISQERVAGWYGSPEHVLYGRKKRNRGDLSLGQLVGSKDNQILEPSQRHPTWTKRKHCFLAVDLRTS